MTEMARTEMARAVLMMSDEQIKATWLREQAWRRDRGMGHYTVLRDVETGKIVATLDK